MQVKVIVEDVDGNKQYLVGTADTFYDFPVTTGLVDQALTFNAAQIRSIIIVTKSTMNGNAFLYVGQMVLGYEAPAEQPAA